MLNEYRGPANSREIFQHLVGEKIKAAFEDDNGQVWIVVESGCALVLTSLGGKCSPAFWKASAQVVGRLVAQRKAAIERQISELKALPGVGL